MNYAKHYSILIERARTRDLESHHIIPRCMGGSNDLSNLVELTPEEHYVAHQLLSRMYPENLSLLHAAFMMASTRKGNKIYGWLRKRFVKEKSKSMMGNKNGVNSPGNTGMKHSTETRQKIANANIGKKHTEETKKLLSEKKKGIPKIKSECPHCNRLFSPTNMARYHGDKCKSK